MEVSWWMVSNAQVEEEEDSNLIFFSQVTDDFTNMVPLCLEELSHEGRLVSGL